MSTSSTPSALSELEQVIGYRFTNRDLLVEAVTHPSYVAENPPLTAHNQRLEFLGDAVIQIIITHRIYHQFPTMMEGEMTRMRAILTRQPALARLARLIGLGNHLLVGKGERQHGGHERSSNLCDAFEALIAAIYLDAGCRLEAATGLVERLVDQAFPAIEDLLLEDNPKGMLQEWAQGASGEKPVYDTVDVEGPDHQRLYTVRVSIGDTEYGIGQGGKRQKAEEEAAKAALKRLRAERGKP